MAFKVLDFGLAKLVEPIGDGAIQIASGERIDLTVDMSTELGALMGTPAYMSPEQIRGTDVDAQTDVWSLGVLLYEMLSGQLPFRGGTKIDLIAVILTAEPVPIGDLGLARCFWRRIAKDLGKRKIRTIQVGRGCPRRTGKVKTNGRSHWELEISVP